MGHRWTYEECFELAKEFKCSAEFKEKQSRAYKAAVRHSWLKDYTWFVPYFRSIQWTYETCYEEARKYVSRKQFQDNSKGAYQRALKQNWLEDYDWMIPTAKPKGYWDNYDRVKEEVKKYNSRTSFYKGNQPAYNAARQNGWLDELIPSKTDVNARLRCVYSYEFKEYNVAYVGLTCDKKRRHLQHIGVHSCGKSSPVFGFATEHEIIIPEPIYWYEDCTVAESQKYENDIVKKYIERGWILLNKAKTGVGHSSLGSTIYKWTKKECYNEARKYHSRTEFSNNCQSAYTKSLQKGWINDYFWFSTLGNKKWTYETCYDEALKYKTRSEFEKGNHPAYQVASQNKWLEKYYWFVKPIHINKPRKWTYESCRLVAQRCNSRSEFVKRNKGAYEASRKNGWLDEFIPQKKLNQYSVKINDPAQYCIPFDNCEEGYK